MIIVYTVVPAVLGTLAVATGVYLYKRSSDLSAIKSVSARSNSPLNEFDISYSKKEIMSEFKLGDEEKGGFDRSRNGPRDFVNDLEQQTSYNSMHTTVDAGDPMLHGQ
jgi:hypothetical protein